MSRISVKTASRFPSSWTISFLTASLSNAFRCSRMVVQHFGFRSHGRLLIISSSGTIFAYPGISLYPATVSQILSISSSDAVSPASMKRIFPFLSASLFLLKRWSCRSREMPVGECSRFLLPGMRMTASSQSFAWSCAAAAGLSDRNPPWSMAGDRIKQRPVSAVVASAWRSITASSIQSVGLRVNLPWTSMLTAGFFSR